MADQKVTRKLAAILATDMVGYSRLIGLDEVGTLARQKAHVAELIEPKITEHNGRIVKTTGDGLLAEFASVVDAMQCALEVQRSIAERETAVPIDRRIAYRIGINIGDVIVENGDVFGDGVNVAARLQEVAESGGICLSDDAYRQVRGKLEFPVRDLGARRLKNISRTVRVYGVAASELGGARRARSASVRRSGRSLAVALAGAALIAAAAVWIAIGPSTPDPGRREAASPRSPTGARAVRVIAVLPFDNRSSGAGQDYFADGITDEVIDALGRFNTLRVIGRNSVRSYTRRSATRTEIASGLGASYLVEGSVWRAERQVRITVRLIDAHSGVVLWSERYEGELSGIFKFQDAIARQIAGKLAVNVAQIEGRLARTRPIPKLDAYDLVLRARSIGFSSTRAANRRFRELAAKAVQMDPDYALAHALLAEAIIAQAILGWTEFRDQELARAESLTRRAIALAPVEPDGHRVLGRLLVVRGEFDQAQAELRRAIELNPSDSNALAVWGHVQLFVGETPGAIEALERALKYDPALEALHVFDLAVAYYIGHRHEDALRTAERGLTQFPDFAMFNVIAAAAAAQLGRKEPSARYVREVRRRLPFLNIDALGSRFRKPAQAAYLRQGLKRAGL